MVQVSYYLIECPSGNSQAAFLFIFEKKGGTKVIRTNLERVGIVVHVGRIFERISKHAFYSGFGDDKAIVFLITPSILFKFA